MPDGTVDIEGQAPPEISTPPPPIPSKAGRKAAKKSGRKPGSSKPRGPAKAAREQSTVVFPYLDLESAVSVAQAMIDAGGVPLTREQLAGAMGQSLGSGSFVLKTATARAFGFIANSQGKHELTTLGFEVVGSDEKEKARRPR